MRPILWENKSNHSIEYFVLRSHESSHILEGKIVLLLEGLPAYVAYKVECDGQWQTRSVIIRQERAGEVGLLALEVSMTGVWRMDDSSILFAKGLCDIDLEISPSTNTLPIRRCDLQEGQMIDVDAVWVRFPSMTLERLQQRYTRIGPRQYRYENQATGYVAQLEVDEQGLIVRYDDLWYRVTV